MNFRLNASRSPALRALVLCALAGSAGGAWAQAPAAAAPPQAVPIRCDALASSVWPRTTIERRRLIDRLSDGRDACKDHAAFLALLGALWLDEGDPDQALLWLERALLIDPGQLGAQADHALALAAQGDHSARQELLSAWRGRADVPAVVLARLQAMAPSSQAGGGAAGNGGNGSGGQQTERWLHVRELTVAHGYESNLNQSPRLNELTITPPDDPPLTLPLPEPQTPRPGQASVLELGWQSAYTPANGYLLQAGVQAVGRSAPGNHDTDWHSVQGALAMIGRWSGWRASLHWTGTWFGGNLNQPYKAHRASAQLETVHWQCQHRWSLDHERRTQAGGEFLNTGQSLGLSLAALCPVGTSRWMAGLALRAAEDRPFDDQRPGGTQRQVSAGLRLLGPLPGDLRLEVSLRYTRSRDAEGYNPLLADGARREMTPRSLAVELTRPVDLAAGGVSGEMLLQVQGVRQGSNIPLFKYSAITGLVGGRLRW